MKHELKCWPEYFQPAWVQRKPFEIRKNDRNFQIDDEIILQEFVPSTDPEQPIGDYTGREIHGVIEYLTSFEQAYGFVVFSYRPTLFSE